MIIRGQQRTTHSNSEKLSGRAKELRDRGFYFLRYHPGGAKPTDVWNILPEDTQRRAAHFAPYPVDLCLIPILATCPEGGMVLDPFCGTGTTLLAARNLGRSCVGIDVSRAYLARAGSAVVPIEGPRGDPETRDAPAASTWRNPPQPLVSPQTVSLARRSYRFP